MSFASLLYPFQMLARLAGAGARRPRAWIQLSFPPGVMPHADSPPCSGHLI